MTIELVAPIIAVAGGLIASLFASRISDLRKKRIEEEEKHVKQLYKKSFNQYLKELQKSYPEMKQGDKWSEYFVKYISYSIPETTKAEYLSEDEIQKRIDEKTLSLKDRIEEIEQRFPSQDTVDKVASVNEAILATQVENLSEAIKGLEQRILSKWDVAKIVFQIIAALGGLIGVILGLITFFVKNSGG